MSHFDPEKVMAEIKDVLDKNGALLVNRYPELIELRLRPREQDDPEWLPEVYGKCVYLPSEPKPFSTAERKALSKWQLEMDELYAKEFPHYPESNRANRVELLCQLSFYDGVLSGIARVNDGNTILFTCADQYPKNSMPREFLYVNLVGSTLDSALAYMNKLKENGWEHLLYNESGSRYPVNESRGEFDRELHNKLTKLSQSISTDNYDGWFTYADTNLGETTREEEIAHHKELIIDNQIEGWDHGAEPHGPNSR